MPGDGFSLPLSERSAIFSSLSPPDEIRGGEIMRLGVGKLKLASHGEPSRCLACCSSSPITGLMPGTGSHYVPANEAIRSHTKCGSDVCLHVDHSGGISIRNIYLHMKISTRCSQLERNKAPRV